jgi:chromosome segregation ATPase|tara:strand:+ start:4573 stop:4773 length:201 start_codon:yes stop_codon:yes gene_type:complete
MTIDEMITDFTEQQSKVKAEVAEIKDALKTREDQLLRLQGAIEGLRLATQDKEEATEAPPTPAKVK